MLYKVWRTPAGDLRQGVRYTDDWPHGEDIPWGDFSAGHCCEPLIKTPDDVAPLALFLATQPDAGATAQSFSLMRRDG